MRLRRQTAPFPDLLNQGGDLLDLLRQLAAAPPRTSDGVAWQPAVELADTDDEILLTAELPGVSRDDVEIEVEDNVLTLKGVKRDEHEEKDRRYHVWERCYGAFERSFILPRSVDPTGIRARFENGVLTVRMPKTQRSRGRTIDISGAD